MLSQIESGVLDASAGSRMTSCGPRTGYWKLCFRWPGTVSLVPPAKLEYSPAEREVGMAMMGMEGGWMSRRLLGPWGRVERSSVVETLFARAFSCQQSFPCAS